MGKVSNCIFFYVQNYGAIEALSVAAPASPNCDSRMKIIPDPQRIFETPFLRRYYTYFVQIML
jgi:hypothetical protein